MTTEKGRQAKASICNATIALINERGYDNVTVADICKRAGVSNGSFFHYFKAKDDVLVEYVRNESEELEAFYAGLAKTDAREVFRQVIQWQARYYQKKGEDVIAHLHAHLIISRHKVVLDYALGRVLQQCIELGRQQGVFKSGADAQKMGTLRCF